MEGAGNPLSSARLFDRTCFLFESRRRVRRVSAGLAGVVPAARRPPERRCPPGVADDRYSPPVICRASLEIRFGTARRRYTCRVGAADAGGTRTRTRTRNRPTAGSVPPADRPSLLRYERTKLLRNFSNNGDARGEYRPYSGTLPGEIAEIVEVN